VQHIRPKKSLFLAKMASNNKYQPVNSNFLARNKSTLLYGTCLAMLLFLLKWLELRFIIINHSFEIYIGAIAIIFTGLGIWLALKLARPKIETVIVEKEIYELNKLNLSKREMEVLQLMSEGLSNQEIALRLFVSLNTIKTHSSKLFEKLDVARRTQAVDKAKKLNIIP